MAEEIKKPVATVKTPAAAQTAATPVAASAPVSEPKKEEAKPAAKKTRTTAKKTAAKKPAAKKTAAAAKKTATKKSAAETKTTAKKTTTRKTTTRKTAAKKVALKTSAVFAVGDGENLSADALLKQYLKSAKDRTKYDLNIKSSELKSIDIYVNVKEQTVYSVVTKTDGTVVNDQFPM